MATITKSPSAAFLILLFICTSAGLKNLQAQATLYHNTFPAGDITLREGPFKHARDLNIQHLMQYDIDRLLAPYRKEAGLEQKAQGYPNWSGLDGHVGGHYLSAMAINYAATGNPDCKKRMDYMLAELKKCQDTFTENHPVWGAGYVGGIPGSSKIWKNFKNGDWDNFRSAWVPWYNLHKMFAGLRDAFVYGRSEEAKKMFLQFCNWGINITSHLKNEEMEAMLGIEHGGMNEVFADAYLITGEKKYLEAAQRFSHKLLLEPMAEGFDNLDNLHANTQVPKAIGFQRIAELTGNEKYANAGLFFWETVTQNRSLAFGGNSRREHFPAAPACTDYITDVEGPESCNTNNMLKLTQALFRVNPSARYADFYERAVFNHILSTQHPEHGGYVYFTPARPRHYRVYSAPNQAMWCCVGTGMENHGKYNEFIYTHHNDSLYLNLFIASELNWREKGIVIKQETRFPFEEKTSIEVTEGTASFTLMVRFPSWVNEGTLAIRVNGEELPVSDKPSSYVAIRRNWQKGDEIEVLLPMNHRLEQLPNVSGYYAFMRGPILLGARTGTHNMSGLVADDSRWAHIAHGERLPLDKAPVIIENDFEQITGKLKPVTNKPFTFTASDLNIINREELALEPFFQIHDSRYMIYWMILSETGYEAYLDSVADAEKEMLELQKRTVDHVAAGEQQPEADHAIKSENSSKGSNLNMFYREAGDGGYFSYLLETGNEENLNLLIRYWGYEWGNRKFDIFVDDHKLITEENTGRWYTTKFQDVEYKIPASMLKGKESVRIKFQSYKGSTAGGIYHVRLIKPGK